MRSDGTLRRNSARAPPPRPARPTVPESAPAPPLAPTPWAASPAAIGGGGMFFGGFLAQPAVSASAAPAAMRLRRVLFIISSFNKARGSGEDGGPGRVGPVQGRRDVACVDAG